jgi:hypothetical protein
MAGFPSKKREKKAIFLERERKLRKKLPWFPESVGCIALPFLLQYGQGS